MDQHNRASILIVSGTASVRRRLIDAADQHDWTVRSTLSGGRRALGGREFDVIVACDDVSDGDVTELVSAQIRGCSPPRCILISRASGESWVIRAFRHGAYDVLSFDAPIDTIRHAINRSLGGGKRRRVVSLEHAIPRDAVRKQHLESALALVAAVEAKEPTTARHASTVAQYSGRIAGIMNLEREQIESISLAGLVHDVGKIAVPDRILRKPGKLSRDEFDTIRRHPRDGVRILQPARHLHGELPAVLHHHERMDGNGYPARLTGYEIPIAARVLCVADALDAMLSPRSYKPGYSLDRAREELLRGSGTQFDPAVVTAATALADEIGQSSFAQSGQSAETLIVGDVGN